MVSGDFSAPISAVYARQWGAPIGEILCCCNENNEIWNLLSHGQLRTDGVSIPTILPSADVVVPSELERLVYEAGGCEEVERYLDACRRGGMGAGSSGHVLVRRVKKATTGSTASSRYFSTTSGV